VQLFKIFPTFYGTRRFITVFTRALHWSLSSAKSIQFIPRHPISLKLILILSTHLSLDLRSCLTFPPVSYMHSSSPEFVLHALPISSSLTYHSNYTWRNVQVMKLLTMQFLQPPVTSSLFGPNVLLTTLFSNILSLCSSPNV
jgi:hypothetical protein